MPRHGGDDLPRPGGPQDPRPALHRGEGRRRLAPGRRGALRRLRLAGDGDVLAGRHGAREVPRVHRPRKVQGHPRRHRRELASPRGTRATEAGGRGQGAAHRALRGAPRSGSSARSTYSSRTTTTRTRAAGAGSRRRRSDGTTPGRSARPWPATRRPEAQALFTLDQQSKLIDPVWGGIYQYSAARDWDSPHFEKLMTFQAPAIDNYAMAYALTKDAKHLARARAILGFLDRFMKSPEGGFYATQDADLNAHDRTKAFLDGHVYYALDEKGRLARGIPRIDVHEYGRENGLAISAYCTMYEVTKDPTVLATAERAARRILSTHATDRGGITHDTVAPEKQQKLLYLSDNAAFGLALVRLYEVTKNEEYAEAGTRSSRDFMFADLARRRQRRHVREHEGPGRRRRVRRAARPLRGQRRRRPHALASRARSCRRPPRRSTRPRSTGSSGRPRSRRTSRAADGCSATTSSPSKRARACVAPRSSARSPRR